MKKVRHLVHELKRKLVTGRCKEFVGCTVRWFKFLHILKSIGQFQINFIYSLSNEYFKNF